MSRTLGPLRFDKRAPCPSCPYRTDAPLRLWSSEEFEDLLASEHDQMDTVYGCHEFNKRLDQVQVCVGWLINQRDHNVPSIALRMRLIQSAEALACYNEATSPVPLYESVEQMCKANGVES